MQATVVNTGPAHGAHTFNDKIPSPPNNRFGTYRCTLNNVCHIIKW